MAKAKIVETIADESLVSVEMSKEQKDQFVLFMAEQEKKKLEEEPASSINYSMDLGWRHNINGKKFGPGKTVVPETYVAQITYAEDQRKKQELNLNQSNNRMFNILMNGQSIPTAIKS